MKYRGSNSSFLKPEYIADSILNIDFKFLSSKGIKAALIDLDGTVVERGKYEVDPKITQALKTQPLKIYIATNRPKSRDLKDLKEHLHANGVIHPRGILGKPFSIYYKQAVNSLGLSNSETIMIGDRYIQDILGANKAGIHTLMVKKLDKPTNIIDKVLSSLERNLLTKLGRTYESPK